MGRLDGKVALISGGARGQGAAEAETFAREGAKVVFGDIRDAEGRKVEADIRAGGGDATYVHLDVTREADWQSAVKTATGRHGRLDILINNAAIVIPRAREPKLSAHCRRGRGRRRSGAALHRNDCSQLHRRVRPAGIQPGSSRHGNCCRSIAGTRRPVAAR